MRLMFMSILVVGSMMTTGCALHGVDGEIAGVDVEARTDKGHDRDGDFCPPGQAKKGNC